MNTRNILTVHQIRCLPLPYPRKCQADTELEAYEHEALGDGEKFYQGRLDDGRTVRIAMVLDD